MRGHKTPGRIVTNFCTGVEVHDVITSANFYDSRIRGFGVVGGGQILGFSIDLHRRPYNTLALPCECVIEEVYLYSAVIVVGPASHLRHSGMDHTVLPAITTMPAFTS